MSLFDLLTDMLEVEFKGLGPVPDAAVACSSGPTVKTRKRSAEESPEQPFKRCCRQSKPTGSHVGLAGGETEEGESDSSSSDMVSLDEETAKKLFCPDWKITIYNLLNTPEICREFMYHVIPPGERLANRRMRDQEFSDEFCLILVALFSSTAELHRRWVQERTRRTTNLEQQSSQAAPPSRAEICLEVIYHSSPPAQRFFHNLFSDKDLSKHFGFSLSGLFSKATELHRRWEKALGKISNLKERLSHTEPQQSGSALQVSRLEQELEKMRVDLAWSKAGRENAIKAEKEKQENIDKLNVLVSSLQAENARLAEDRNWLISRGFSQVFNKVKSSREFLLTIASVNQAATKLGYQNGLKARFRYAKTGVELEKTPNFDPNAVAHLKAAANALQCADHSLIKKISESVDLFVDELKALIASTSS